MSFQIGATIAGKYRILQSLGEGGMGAVFLAENVDIGRQVAIKVLHAKLGRDADTMARFRQEARASSTIQHPGIVDVLDMGRTDDGEAYIVMERLEGETLAARLKQRGRLSVDEIVSVMVEVLDALAAAHDKGIIHRDLKPENLFLVWRPRWIVKILDFGISRLAGAEDVRLTATNTTMGSVLYMPPEQAKNAKNAGVPADLYAIGAVIYHAVAGRPPFIGTTQTEVLSAVLSEPAPPLSQLAPAAPPALGELVDKLLAKKPEARPQSAREVRDALLAIVGGKLAQPEPLVRPAPAATASLALDATAAPASGLDATAAPEGLAATAAATDAVGETAAASAPPKLAGSLALSATAAATDAPHASIATVSPVDTVAPRARRRWLAPAIVGMLALGGGGVLVATHGGHAPAGPSDAASAKPAAAADAPVLTVAPPDAASDAAAAAAAAPPADAAVRQRPHRPDAGAAAVIPDASQGPRDAGHTMTQFERDL